MCDKISDAKSEGLPQYLTGDIKVAPRKAARTKCPRSSTASRGLLQTGVFFWLFYIFQMYSVCSFAQRFKLNVSDIRHFLRV